MSTTAIILEEDVYKFIYRNRNFGDSKNIITRIHQFCIKSGLETVYDLTLVKSSDIARVRNAGRRTHVTIKWMLEENGITKGMIVEYEQNRARRALDKANKKLVEDTKKDMRSKKVSFEYKRYSLSSIEKLNKLGKEGWEIADSWKLKDDTYEGLFKRTSYND